MPKYFKFILMVALLLGMSPMACARGTAAPDPSNLVVTDVLMSKPGKQQEGSFSVSWKPAKDLSGKDRTLYAVQTAGCKNVTDAKGRALPVLSGKFSALSGPPYTIHLSNCACTAAVHIRTAYISPEAYWSNSLDVPKGTVPFGPPCAPQPAAK